MEKLYIENFGGITKAEIELNKMNVFIGPQASGKSICAKLFYFFKKIPVFLFQEVVSKKQISINLWNNEYLAYFKEIFPPHTFPKNHFTIKYTIQNEYFEIIGSKKGLQVNYSSFYTNVIDWINKLIVKILDEKKQGDNTRFSVLNSEFSITNLPNLLHKWMQEKVGGFVSVNQLFIPSGRSFLAVYNKNLPMLVNSNQLIADKLFLEFSAHYNLLKNRISFNGGEKSLLDVTVESRLQMFPQVKNIYKSILSSEYVNENDVDYLVHSDGRKVDVTFASSGQQESLPLILMLVSNLDFPRAKSLMEIKENTMYIEEPEAHLFPSAQKTVVELIASVFNSNGDDTQFVITTHSPYVITSFDNLMQAGELSKTLNEEKKQELYNIVPKEQIIIPDKVNAYVFDNGTCKSIIDTETKLIVADALDNVSTDIAIQFDKLLDLED